MNSKIVILTDSVILYQHYISDEAWESVMAFPRGGLTYLIKNNNIKFYAYIDYFYRNCLMTMDLPIYIVDEEMGIDGEFDDIEELTEILNRIFPASDNGEGVDLTPYLRKKEAEETYQPIGFYFDEVEYDSSGKTIDFYSDGALVDSIDATEFIKDGMVDHVELITLSGDTYLHIVFNTDAGKEPIDINLGDLFDADNYYTKDETDDLLDEKLDASAYTPVDLSNYYNKQETDDLLDDKLDTSAYTPVDLSDYYTKEEIDVMIPSVPSLSGYATQEWVLNQRYVNESTFNTYILNLTQQIQSLQYALEACCSGQTGETIYRWITLTGSSDYICSGTTKYTKEQKQQSTDNGITWENVVPAEYRTGEVIEEDSVDCGGSGDTPVILSAEYITEDITSNSWPIRMEATGNIQRITFDVANPIPSGSSFAINSVTGEITFTDKCDLKYTGKRPYYYDWNIQIKVDGVVVRTLTLPYIDEMRDTGRFTCANYDKYKIFYIYRSYDNGESWCYKGAKNELVEKNSEYCGYTGDTGQTIEYRWVTLSGADDYICIDTTKYSKEQKQQSTDGGQTWANVSPAEYREGEVIQTESTDCGYVPPAQYKFYGLTRNGSEKTVYCNSSTELTKDEVKISISSYVSISIGSCVSSIAEKTFLSQVYLTDLTIPGNVKTLGRMSFANVGISSLTLNEGVETINEGAFVGANNLSDVTIPNSVKTIGNSAFYVNHIKNIVIGTGCTSIGMSAFQSNEPHESITIYATTPPTLYNDYVFFTTSEDNSPIYVPAASVNAYKTAQHWSYYASRIQAIP